MNNISDVICTIGIISMIISLCFSVEGINKRLDEYNKTLEKQNELILKLVESYDK